MRIQLLSLAVAATIGIAALAGCANKTEGDKTIERADTIKEAGMMMKRGESEINDGKATEARGQSMKDQGQTADGERLINEGQSMQKKGQADIDQGKKMKM